MSDERRIERIEAKVDTISDKLGETNNILAAQHESLKLHMKRSDMLEKALKPLQRHVSMLEGALKLVGFIASATVLIEIVRRLI
jgi:uncharacterized coiled-coil protein SlyX